MYQTFQQFTNQTGQSGLDQMLLYVSNVVPAFIPLVLFAVWVISVIGGYFSMQAINGRANFWGSCAVGSYLTLVIAFLMSLVPNLISGFVLVVCFVVAIISTAIFLLQDNDRGI